MKIIVIADDLTGAAEVAGAALRFGLSAEVQVGQICDSSAEVIVVDADSRSLDPATAIARVFELTVQALALRPDVLFKKVDSLLRGPVAAEIAAVRAAGGFQRCLLACGNPRKQRTVVGGKIFVDRVPLHETSFAQDPEHPCTTNDVAELLLNPTAIRIGDVESSGDLLVHARHWHSRRWTSLAAGGAEFFEAVLAVCLKAAEPSWEASWFEAGRLDVIEDMPLVVDGEVLLISGSSMAKCDGWPLVSYQGSQASSSLAGDVCRLLHRHGRAAIRAADIAVGSPESRINILTEIASDVLAHCRPSQVWIEGGRTASKLIRELGYQRMVAVANAGDGIVALRSIDENSPLYVIKPGSYPWVPPASSAIDESAIHETEGQSSRVGVSLGNASGNTLVKYMVLLSMVIGASKTIAAEAQDFAAIASILSEQCIDCHNAETREGTVDLSRFNSVEDIDRDRSLWKTLFDVVEAQQMPLPDSGYELNDQQRESLLSFSRQMLSRPDPNLKAIDPGKPILRRLTRLEYNNTVRDLFGLDYDIFMFPERLPIADKDYFQHGTVVPTVKESNHVGDQRATFATVVETSMREYGQKYDVLLPQLGLPADNRAEHGFANRGDALNFSPLLFEKYLEMAAAIVSSDRLLADSGVLQDLLGIEPPTPKPVANRGTVVPTVSKQSDHDHGGDHRATLQARIDGFLNRAHRRQITDTELQTAVQFVESQINSGQTETPALQRMVQAVLSSPEFLFLSEPIIESAGPVRKLGPYELANRLSYFLWSSMPDKELLSVAKSGSILDAEVLRTQVHRMLAERSHSRELSESFAVQWLRLDQLYSSKPDRKLFKKFYSGPQGKSTLHGPMMIEALLLFETVLAEDRSILDLYDPDFTWLNQQLAKLYGLEDSYRATRATASARGLIADTLDDRTVSKTWIRTPLPDRTRGGVMTMAGPLTLTSLPFRTSPIKRGAWLLETVFNRPPSEPKVAFVLEEAVSEESDGPQIQTVRQLFEKHRSDPNCNSCHSRIDPPGFSLEVFDAMGELRTHDGEQPVDASGTWNDHDFASPAEFKDAIRAGEQELVRGFVEHMLSYALGRQLEHFDMQAVDQIVADTSRDGYRMSDIIEATVLSYPFQHVRNQP
ncbi:DUF1592 domain-containing protein [Neorhodopirellula pilleata]|uniref:Planctomycete cytochrome C n=1 Tax=Neorhodopirellula pilleata TaxID=2714738 RepID=A0A5C6AIF8_9BACT|nr:DUF1592 domain-containing protein [Neorhodopirellula pilleata]TWT98955.1 hypothetical protein Pla100_21210 [Neorhodopirellula pilleata]